MARRKTADEKEILRLLSAFLRGEIEGAGPRERLRAAELLGKRLGLFEIRTDDGGPVVIEGSV
ncbi:MAG: hypothetical protein LBH95_02910 [Oscillospiraceae bacterium]|jgi:hypothetical protein|nr:hypothetical protein [Oscillospiraceae bacterium]